MHKEYHTIWQGYTCGNAWKTPDFTWVIINLKGKPIFTGSLQYMRHGPVHMNLSWRSPRINMVTNISTGNTVSYKSRSVWLTIMRVFPLHKPSLLALQQTLFNTDTSWNISYVPHYTASDHISYGQDQLCYTVMLSHCQHSDWSVQKMEQGSSGTCTAPTRYEPMWLQPLSDNAKTTAWHLLQDQRWYREHTEHKITDRVKPRFNVPIFSKIPDLVMIFSCPDNSSI
jgi:hypothetical protein